MAAKYKFKVISGYIYNFGIKGDISQNDENSFLDPETLLTYKNDIDCRKIDCFIDKKALATKFLIQTVYAMTQSLKRVGGIYYPYMHCTIWCNIKLNMLNIPQ